MKEIRAEKLRLAHRLFMIDTAIYVMLRADAYTSVDMTSFQHPKKAAGYAISECDLHKCGNTACFAGHIAVSAEFATSGGRSNEWGSPMIINTEHHSLETEDDAIAYWLDLYDFSDVVDDFIYELIYGNKRPDDYCDFYKKDFAHVTAKDVIKKLKKLKKLVKKVTKDNLNAIKK